MENYEPKIIAFCCHYCAYSAADLAGSARMQYPPNVRIVRTPCTGRLEIDFYLKAFENGIDGILVAGCEEGSCHFKDGNLLAKRRVNSIRALLAEAGIAADRLRMVNVGAADARPLVEYIKEHIETVRKLGPLNIEKSAGKTATGAVL
jgi:F420-non-reducing hydrogenase iron-sulfur subunit